MNSLIASQIIGGNSDYGRNKGDFYPTPPEVTQALLDFLGLSTLSADIDRSKIWIYEPACGEGHMVKVFQQNGFSTIASDIETGDDFLLSEKLKCNWIITNPPFNLADKFIEKCASFDVPFALLLKAHYWNAKKRYGLFYRYQPKYILPLTWRPDFMQNTRGAGSPMLDVMWCVWLPTNGLYKQTTEFIPLLKPVKEDLS